MSKKDWTNKLQEQLADYQVPAKDDLWASISQSLAQQDSPAFATKGDTSSQTSGASSASDSSSANDSSSASGSSEPAKAARIVMFKRWSAAAAVALVLAGGVAVYWHQMETEEDAPLAQISTEPKSPMKSLTAVQHDATTENVDASAECDDACSTVNDDASSSSSSQIHGCQKTTMNDVESSVQQDEAAVCSMAEEREVAPTTQSKQQMVASRNDHLAQDDALFGVDYANPHSAKGDGMSYSSDGMSHFSDGMLHSSDAAVGNWTVNLFAENMVADHGTGMSNNGYHMLASAPEGFFADQNDFYMTVALQSRSPLYVESKHHAPLSVGALVGVNVAPRLVLNTGVVYTRVASDFKTVRMDEFNIHQVLHYVGVSLGLNYEFWRKGVFHTYVMAGAQADFNVKNDTEDNGVKVDEAKRDRVQFSGKASLGAQVDVLPSVGIYVEPGAKYYFNNGSKIENTFKDKKWNFNFQFGLRVNL